VGNREVVPTEEEDEQEERPKVNFFAAAYVGKEKAPYYSKMMDNIWEFRVKRVPRTPMRHLDHIWSCLHEYGDSAPRPALYAPLSGSRSLWLEPAAHLGLRVLVFCPSLLGREGERRRR
jgi:hypothetical protein